MSKLEKILKLTSDKSKQFVLTLNFDLVKKFKSAAEKNNIKITQLVETWMIEYIDKNGLLDD